MRGMPGHSVCFEAASAIPNMSRGIQKTCTRVKNRKCSLLRSCTSLEEKNLRENAEQGFGKRKEKRIPSKIRCVASASVSFHWKLSTSQLPSIRECCYPMKILNSLFG